MDWSDKRLVDEIPFAMGNPEQERAQADIRDTFKKLGCKDGDDIARVGCTGLASAGYDVNWIQWIRENMAGSGIGLTCFVPPSRFCFVHNTIGGLQEDQEQHHAEHVEKISRELAPAEKAKVAFVENVRRLKGRSKSETLQMMQDALKGKQIPQEVLQNLQRDLDGDDGPSDVLAGPAPQIVLPEAPPPDPMPEPFTCPEHGATMWGCRFCLAELIVKGPYTPKLILAVAPEGTSVLPDTINEVAPDDVENKIAYLDENMVDGVGVYVQVTRWIRRLCRER